MYRDLVRKKVVWMYFFAMLAYVGCEQGTADWISKFLSQYTALTLIPPVLQPFPGSGD